MCSNETWLPVNGYEDYYLVSNYGNVKSLRKNRFVGWTNKSIGYRFVGLVDGEGKTTIRTIHSLVAEAFIGARPDGLEVAHLDGVRDNNVAENLMYATRLENARHTWLHGTHIMGSASYTTKLSEDDVAKIRRSIFDGEYTQRELAMIFDVSPQTINSIHKCRSWGHVEVDP